ncbi:MAG: DUF1127 domain-containing protein [Paracoccaceae bacterium]|nr:DUF1127 domain-containing protein [Paracoccaceae bacterium]
MPHISTLPSRPSAATRHALPLMARRAFALGLSLVTWENRRQSRKALGRLDAHLLRDIGLSSQDATAEAAKPFWQA